MCSREAEGAFLSCGEMADKRKNYYIRCGTCGRAGSAVSRAALTPGERAGAESNAFRLSDRRQAEEAVAAEIVRNASARRAAENDAWWRKYDEYLQSDKWRFDKREPVLVRDNYECQANLACCTQDATQVHHTTYEHVFDEPLFDLVAVCRECHEEITRMDRSGSRTIGMAS